MRRRNRSAARAGLPLPAREVDKRVTFTRANGERETFSLHWILAHVEEHEIHHRAQLNLYLRLMGITPPSV